ncbi:MAG: glycoside hydrolase family 5 protein [Prevotella sp.]|nr:glycoside hydrolase family 5 protein [Prevotella sp.]
MKKFFTTFFCLLLISMQAQAQEFESATDAVKNMGVGWNLGNTLDANSQSVTDPALDAFWGQQGLESETCWGQPKTTRELIHMMKEAGFTAIRVPVTWYNHMDPDLGTIDAEWMKRVHEVVDYVIDEGLYCIINVHHDTGADSKDGDGKLTGYHWIKADEENYTKHGLRFIALWLQIAAEFKDYGEKLLFEGYNEMLDKLSSWCFASFAASGQYDANIAASAYSGLNSYAQAFITTVRSTGGNNANRNLIVNTYAAAYGGGNWNKHLSDVLTELNVTDEAEGHLAFEVHAYPTLSSGKSEVDDLIDKVNTNLLPKGPVIVGEWGTSNVDNGSDYIDHRETMINFCDYFVKKCKENNIATFYWMGLSDGDARSQLVFNQPDLAKTITKAYHGDDFEGVYPAMEVADETVVFEGEQQLEWGQAINFPATLFTNLSNTSTVEVTYTEKFDQFSGDEANSYLQFWYNDWSSMINFTADGQDVSETLEVNKFYNSTSGTEHTTVFAFDKETFNNFKKKGMLFQGHGVLLTKVVLKAGEKDPDEGGDGDSKVIWEGDEMLDWGDGLQLNIFAEDFAAIGKGVKLCLYYTLDFTDYNMIQLFYGDWSANPSFIINGQEIDKEFRPSDLYGLGNGEDGVSELTFNDDILNMIFEKGIALQGHGIRLKKVVLAGAGSTGIQNIIRTYDSNAPIYNLAGQRVTNPKKGIYIKNGKKFILK